MSTPSPQAQLAAVQVAIRHAREIAKAAGLRNNAQIDLLRDQLAAAARTLQAAIETSGKPAGRS